MSPCEPNFYVSEHFGVKLWVLAFLASLGSFQILLWALLIRGRFFPFFFFFFKSPLFLISLQTTSLLAPGSAPQAETLQQALSFCSVSRLTRLTLCRRYWGFSGVVEVNCFLFKWNSIWLAEAISRRLWLMSSYFVWRKLQQPVSPVPSVPSGDLSVT